MHACVSLAGRRVAGPRVRRDWHKGQRAGVGRQGGPAKGRPQRASVSCWASPRLTAQPWWWTWQPRELTVYFQSPRSATRNSPCGRLQPGGAAGESHLR